MNIKLIYEPRDLKQLKEDMKKITNIETVQIVTAFISESDNNKTWLEELVKQHDIAKENIEIYLSPEFVPYHKKEILEYLLQFATVYIIENLHAKAYYIKGDTNYFAFGSSNFTNNGFGENLELMGVCDSLDEKKIQQFMRYCKQNACLVEDKLLHKYENIDQLAEKVKASTENKILKKAIDDFKKQLITTHSEDFPYGNLSDYYFNHEDYETFNAENSKSDELFIKQRRGEVQRKLIEIHKQILPALQRMGLNCHYNKKNITNSIALISMNKQQLGWLGVRYWNDVSKLKILRDSDFGAAKFSDLQFCLTSKYFQIGLFHAVPNDAIDREYLHSHINQLQEKIIEELKKIVEKVDRMIWIIHNDQNKFEFDFAKEKIEDFIAFYKENDQEGYFSELLIAFEPSDERIKTKEGICKLITETFEVFLPLYLIIINPTSYKNII